MKQNLEKIRPLTSRKLDPQKEKDMEYIERIHNYFNDPNHYLTIDENIIVGKKINAAFNVSENSNNSNSKIIIRKHLQITKPVPSINYEIINEAKAEVIFDNIENRIIKNNKTKKIEKDKRLIQQENILSNDTKQRVKSAQISKYISNKINKSPKELLMNNIHSYRNKKQSIDIKENEKHNVDKFGDHYWISDLRRYENTKFINTFFVNIVPFTNNLKFEQINEYPIKPTNIIHKPNDNDSINLYNLNKDSNQINKIIPSVKNVFMEEKKRATSNKGSRLIYKEPNILKHNEIIKEYYDKIYYIK